MKKIHLPYLAAAVGLTLMPMIILGNTIGEDGLRVVPLLSLLIMNEFAFLLNVAGAYVGIQQLRLVGFQLLYGFSILLCVLLSLLFAWFGIQLWPL